MHHQLHDATSLALAQRIAALLPQHPEWIVLARRNLDQWSRRNADAPSLLRCYDQWKKLLDRPMSEICAVLTGHDSESQRLRHNSPFAGALPAEVVLEIKQRMRHESTAA